MDLDKPVSFISKHANTQFTHWWLICHKNWFIIQGDLPSVMRYMSPELAYLKHCNAKEINFQEIVVSGNVLKS